MDASNFAYRAFLSYSHRDKSWCEWLHKSLKSFVVDDDLVGRATLFGPVPRNLRPIFRDRTDFSAGFSLQEQSRQALRNSLFLIVIASPNSANSPYVSEEIEEFRKLGGSERILVLIVSGEPAEAFSPALRQNSIDPIAADARDIGDGKSVAFLKIVSALIGVQFDDLRKREAIAYRKRTTLRTATIGLLAVLGLVAGVLFLELRRTEENLHESQAQIEKLVNQLLPSSALAAPGQRQALKDVVAYGEEKAARGDAGLQQAMQDLAENRPTDASDVLLKRAAQLENAVQRDRAEAAAMYRRSGVLASLKDPETARVSFAKAVDLEPENPEGLFWDGWFALQTDHLDEAEQAYKRLLALPNNSAEQRFWAEVGLGDIARRRGDRAEALSRYRNSQNITDQLQLSDRPEEVRYLAIVNTKIGELQRSEGNSNAATKSFEASLAYAERLARAHPETSAHSTTCQ